MNEVSCRVTQNSYIEDRINKYLQFTSIKKEIVSYYSLSIERRYELCISLIVGLNLKPKNYLKNQPVILFNLCKFQNYQYLLNYPLFQFLHQLYKCNQKNR